MANRRSPPECEELLAPLWVVTFSDLISLLVTFFVLLFTFSTMDEDQFNKVQGTMGGGLGVMAKGHSQSRPNVHHKNAPLNAQTDRNGVEDPARRKELEVQDDLKRMVQDSSFNVRMDSEVLGDGLRIRLEGDEVFGPGTTQLLPEAEETVRELARMVRSMPVGLAIETHVDSQFSQLSRYRDARLMTRDMALKLAQILLKETGWSPTRISISPMGDARPVASNEDALGRSRNRRVEILIMRDAELDSDG